MLQVTYIPVGELKPSPHNARTHSKRQLQQIAKSIKQFGFLIPILADENNVVIAGHGRLEAALQLKMKDVPVVRSAGLTDAQKRLFMLADNKIASNAGWNREQLAIEFSELSGLLKFENLEIELSGFATAEVDQILVDHLESPATAEDAFEEPRGKPVSRSGDLWLLGQHRLLCGNARSPEAADRLMGGELASMVFADPPYNVAVRRVVGRGRTKHREFEEASGEQTEAEFTQFLNTTLGNASRVSTADALHFVCMDWRHCGELLSAAKSVYAEHVNTAVWVKTNAGMGSLYRSQHELIHIFRVGSDQHLNNVELGRYGRSRTNVWHYAGATSFRAGRMDELRTHPTVKPVGLVSDAMRDCTKLRQIVLDPFCGSGTTIIAAERVGRRGFGLEIDSLYVDTAVRRWEELTGKDAVLCGSNSTFTEVRNARKR